MYHFEQIEGRIRSSACMQHYECNHSARQDWPLLCRWCSWKEVFHRVTEKLRLDGTSGDHLVQHPAQVGPPRATCSRPCPDDFWIPSRMDTPPSLWAASASAWSASQCFLLFGGNLLCAIWCLLVSAGLLSLSLGTTGKSLVPSSWHSPWRCLYRWVRSPKLPLLQAEGSSQLSQPFPVGREAFLSLHHPCGPLSPSPLCSCLPNWGAQNSAQPCRCGLSSAEQRAGIPSLHLPARLCLRMALCFFKRAELSFTLIVF